MVGKATAYSYAELLALDVPEPRWLIDPFLPEQGVLSIGGEGGVGKTWLALSMGRAIAAGGPWLDRHPTIAAPVLFIDEESILARLKQRVELLERGCPIGPDAPVHFAVGNGLAVDDQAGFDRLNDLLADRKPGVVFIDSLVRTLRGDENSANDMAYYNSALKLLMAAHNCAIVVLDHTRKGGPMTRAEDRLRGSSEKRAFVDAALMIDADPADPLLLKVTTTKARFAEAAPPFAVRLVIDNVAGTARLDYVGEAKRDDGARAPDVVAAIRALQQQLGDPDAADAVRIAAYLDCAPETARRHVRRLVDAGILTCRKGAASAKGGPRREIFDLPGGDEDPVDERRPRLVPLAPSG